MKTIFLVIADAIAARSLLRTDILPTLKMGGARVVILAPNADEAYFQDEFSGDNVFIERLNATESREYFRNSRLQRVLKVLRLFTLNYRAHLCTVRWYMDDYVNKEMGKKRALAPLLRGVVWTLRRFRWARRGLLFFETVAFPGPSHNGLFETYQPDLLVISTLGRYPEEAYIMRKARRLGVKVVTAMQSWDHTDNKGIGGGWPDWAIAWTPTMKQELVTGHDFRGDRVLVGGVPHFDVYHSGSLLSWSELCQRLNLNPERKLLLFATNAPGIYDNHEDVLEHLVEAIVEKRTAGLCQVVVRLHPHYCQETDYARQARHRLLDRISHLRELCPYIIQQSPTILSRQLDEDRPAEDMVMLASLIKHSALLINMFSTLTIEAALMDVPVVNVAFERTGPPSSESYRPLRKRLEYHAWLRRMVSSGCSRIVDNKEELLEAINAYLNNPELDKEGRLLVSQQECGPSEGKAGQRVGTYLLEMAGIPTINGGLNKPLGVPMEAEQ